VSLPPLHSGKASHGAFSVLRCIALLLTNLVAVHVHAENSSTCPTSSGIYRIGNGAWTELERQGRKEKIKAAFPFHNSATASVTELSNDPELCASCVLLETLFSLGKEESWKHDWQIVVDLLVQRVLRSRLKLANNQVIDLSQKREQDGICRVRTTKLPRDNVFYSCLKVLRSRPRRQRLISICVSTEAISM